MLAPTYVVVDILILTRTRRRHKASLFRSGAIVASCTSAIRSVPINPPRHTCVIARPEGASPWFSLRCNYSRNDCPERVPELELELDLNLELGLTRTPQPKLGRPPARRLIHGRPTRVPFFPFPLSRSPGWMGVAGRLTAPGSPDLAPCFLDSGHTGVDPSLHPPPDKGAPSKKQWQSCCCLSGRPPFSDDCPFKLPLHPFPPFRLRGPRGPPVLVVLVGKPHWTPYRPRVGWFHEAVGLLCYWRDGFPSCVTQYYRRSLEVFLVDLTHA